MPTCTAAPLFCSRTEILCQGQSCTPCSTPTNSREHVPRKIYMCAVKLQAATFFHPPKMVKPTVIAQSFL